MSLLAPRVLLGRWARVLKAVIQVPKAVIRVLRSSKARPLARRVSVTSLRTWQAGAVLEAPGRARLLAPVPSAACRTLLLGGSLRAANFPRWATARGTRIPSRRALAAHLALQLPRAFQLPLARVVSRQTRLRTTRDSHRSRFPSDLLPTRNPSLRVSNLAPRLSPEL